jgi:hypothetical protein
MSLLNQFRSHLPKNRQQLWRIPPLIARLLMNECALCNFSLYFVDRPCVGLIYFCNDNIWVPLWGFCILCNLWLCALYFLLTRFLNVVFLCFELTRFFLWPSLSGDMARRSSEAKFTNWQGEIMSCAAWYCGEIIFARRAFLCVDWFYFSVSVFLGFRNCLLTGQSFYCGGWKLFPSFIPDLQLQILGFGDFAAYK